MLIQKWLRHHFALLKRTAKKDNVEIFRVTSGPRKVENATKLLTTALTHISQNRITLKIEGHVKAVNFIKQSIVNKKNKKKFNFFLDNSR